MQLTRFTDYSLRVLMYLAAEPDRLARIDEIAVAYDISKGHLMKAVRGLSGHGFVESVRGRGGGLRLARPAEDINVGDVVRKTEENLSIVDCFVAHENCVIQPVCELQNALAEALEAFLSTLDAYTLAELVRNKAKMSRLLQIS